MKVIFLQSVPRVGKRNEVKEVNDGYALNFLFPRKLAERATETSVKNLELRKKEIIVEREVQTDLLMKNLEELKGKTVIIEAKADEKGHLFSGIHKKEIIEAMQAEHIGAIADEFIILPKPIKELGEFDIPVEINKQKSFFKLIVKAK